MWTAIYFRLVLIPLHHVRSIGKILIWCLCGARSHPHTTRFELARIIYRIDRHRLWHYEPHRYKTLSEVIAELKGSA